jgi:tryptophanyl-tRNA synthetase
VMAGLLNYPVLQAADILLYRADTVPVGEDQVQHLELSRVVARNWNARFSPDEPYFPEPKPRLTQTRRIVGLDGQNKMSKSLGNTIGLLETPEQAWDKLKPVPTDPKRVRKDSPGEPNDCPIVYPLHKAFSPADVVREVEENCRGGKWGCIECKKVLHHHMMEELDPIRARAESLQGDKHAVKDALAEGAVRARRIARETMDTVRERMGLDGIQ